MTEHRAQAVVLSQTLSKAGKWVREPGMTVADIKANLISSINEAPDADD